jgi:hypothetical protein
MALSGSSYPVQRSAGQCSATGRAFAVGELYIATLVEREHEGVTGLERVDFSQDAWAAGQRPAPPMRLFAAWKSSYRPGEQTRRPILGDAELLELFEELGEGGGDAGVGGPTTQKQIVFRYVLALLLIRRRMLRMIGTRRVDGGSIMLVVPKGGDPTTPVEVLDPRMDDTAIQDAIDQLGQILDTDAPVAGTDAPAAGGGGAR